MYDKTITTQAPSRRNRDIFHSIRVEKKSFGDVAKERSLSKGRVSGIVKQVEKWIAATAGSPQGTTWQDRLFIAEEIHRQRLDHLYQQALVGWQTSRDVIRTEKVTKLDGKPTKEEITTKTQSGDRRYLETALKVETSRMTFEKDSEQLQHAPPAGTPVPPVAETDEQIYWQPWKQRPEEIAKAKAKIHEYAEVRGLPFPTTHIEKVKIECQMTDEWREEQARRLAGDWESAEPQADSIWSTVYKVSSAAAAERAGESVERVADSFAARKTTPPAETAQSKHATAGAIAADGSSEAVMPRGQVGDLSHKVPPAKRVLHHMSWFTPMVASENRKRALIHPSKRPPRQCPPGWEEPGSEVPPRW